MTHRTVLENTRVFFLSQILLAYKELNSQEYHVKMLNKLWKNIHNQIYKTKQNKSTQKQITDIKKVCMKIESSVNNYCKLTSPTEI